MDDLQAALSKEKDGLGTRLTEEKEQMKLMYEAKLQFRKEQAAEQTVKLKAEMRAASNRKLQNLEQKVREYTAKVAHAAEAGPRSAVEASTWKCFGPKTVRLCMGREWSLSLSLSVSLSFSLLLSHSVTPY